MADETVSQIRVYLWPKGMSWSKEQSEKLLDDLGDFFAERGFGVGKDDVVHSVITIGNTEVPEDVSEFVAKLGEDSLMIIVPKEPGADG